MKTIKFLTYSVFVLLLSISITSCKGDDGAVGPAGADGTNGINGADGNANVQTYVFENPTWSSNVMTLTLPAITQSVLDEDVVLGFWRPNQTLWYGTNEHYAAGYLRDYPALGSFSIKAYNFDDSIDTTPPSLTKVKIIIIESTNTTTTTGNGRPANTKQQILGELENAGIDTGDYEAVCTYYGIDPK